MTAVTATTPVELFASLRKAGIQLWREGDQLRYRAAAGTLNAELRQQLLARKSEILELLKNAGEPEPPLQTVPRDGNLPLSFAQQRLWFFDQFEPNNAIYNIAKALRLAGALDVIVLHRCLNEILRRHEALRTCFKTVEGEPLQAIQPAASLEMPLVDLAGLPKPERKQAAARLCVEEAQRPFDLTRGVLLRAKLFRLSEADHILLLTMHHIASDGWSLGLLNQELGGLYAALIEGKPSPLPELPIQYADYAVWQRALLQGEALERQLDYWRKRLDGAPAVLELPTDRSRPAVQSYRGALMTGELPKPLSAALKELSRAEGATLFMTLLAAFQTLLHRYSGGDQIVVGSPIDGRQRPELERLIGFFVNTLIMRGDLSGDPSFRILLARTREAALGAYAHQDLPFEKLVEELHPDRSRSRTPLFQVMFALQNAPGEETPALPGLEVAPIPIDIGFSKFDLTFHVRERDGRLRIMAEYCTDLFEAETIRRMLGHYQMLLEGIVVNPDERLSDLPLLTEAERHQLLVEWNHTTVDYPKDRCLHELFEEQAERTPEAVAVVLEDEQLTYGQLNERANQLARHLQGLGVGPDTLVGICVERSLEMVVGLLGILKAGGAYVPLDPEYPKERLAFMLEDADVPVLMTEAHLMASLPASKVRIVRLIADWPLIAKESVDPVTSFAGPEHLAYMIYTSGSTGRPKGAMNTHVAIVNRLLWMQETYRLTPFDRVLQKTPFSFDVSVWEFFWPLLTGATLVVALPGGHQDGAYLANLIRKEKITTIHFVPSMLSAFLEQEGLETSCASLKRVICSGEALPFELQQRFFSLLPAELHNLYGPTEAAVDVTYWACERESRLRTVPIGRPIANTQIRILDQHLQPVPIGVPGGLHIGGIGLARGYHNRPELTAEKFIPDPFRSEPGARLYKTGDLARYLPDGPIEYLGRLDHQVKIRGFRIELGEIESVLAAHPAVREVVALAREDVPGDKRLVAFLTVKEGEPPIDSELRGLLRAKLPEYMIPSAFVILDRLPLTPNGKVDRKALPRPDLQSSNPDEFVAPNTQMEKALASIWRQALGVDCIGLHDNFFELGGHSLLAVRVIGEINKTLDVYMNVPQFFQNPTIERLASSLEQKHHVRPKPRVLRLQPGQVDPPLYFVGAGPVEIRIAKLMGENRAVFGTDVPMPIAWRRAMANADRAAWPTMEQLGALHGEVVRAHAGTSPCVVAGYSFQGKVVIEVARALQRLGGNLALVLLIDSTVWTGTAHGIIQTVRRNLSRIRRGPATGTPDDAAHMKSFSTSLHDSWRLLRWLLAQAPPRIKRRLALARSLNPYVDDANGFVDEEGAPVGLADVQLFFRVLMMSFQPPPLDAAAVLFRTMRPRDEMLPSNTLDNGWGGRFTRGLEIVEAKGDHWSLVKDERNAAALARQINAVLDRHSDSRRERRP